MRHRHSPCLVDDSFISAIWLHLVLVKVYWDVLLLCWTLSPVPYHLFITFTSKEVSGRKRFNHQYWPLTTLQDWAFKHKEDLYECEFNHCGKVEFKDKQQQTDRQTLTQHRIEIQEDRRRKAERLLCNFLFMLNYKTNKWRKKARVSKALCCGLLVRVWFVIAKILNG